MAKKKYLYLDKKVIYSVQLSIFVTQSEYFYKVGHNQSWFLSGSQLWIHIRVTVESFTKTLVSKLHKRQINLNFYGEEPGSDAEDLEYI